MTNNSINRIAVVLLIAISAISITGCDAIRSDLDQLCTDLHWCDVNNNVPPLPAPVG
jgi:hypothetical protein